MFEIQVEESGKAVITGAINIGCIDAFHAEMTKLFDNDACSVIDITGVSEMDTAALQVLITFKRSLSELNRNVQYVAGPHVIEPAELLGFKRLFRAA